jgi:hypothetical protein
VRDRLALLDGIGPILVLRRRTATPPSRNTVAQDESSIRRATELSSHSLDRQNTIALN